MRFLLNHGADINWVDENGLTCLDYALEANQFAAATLLLQHNSLTLTMPNNKDLYPLEIILTKNNYDLLQQAVSALYKKLPDDAVFEVMAKTLTSYSIAPARYNSLSETLGQMQGLQALPMQLLAYCKKQDAQAAFLVEAGKLFAEEGQERLRSAGESFIKQQLALLNNENTDIEKEKARHRLFFFLFAMPIQTMIAFLATVSLDSQQRTQLELLLNYCFVHPAVYTRLGIEEQGALSRYLSHDALQSLATVHFEQSDLTTLAPETLQTFSKSLSSESLYQLSLRRRNPTLVILALSKLLNAQPRDQLKIDELIIQLTTELQLFNEENSSTRQNEFAQMLNLATDLEVKAQIRVFIDGQASSSPIHHKMKGAFLLTNNKSPFVKDSLLSNYAEEYLHNANILTEPNNQRVLSQLLSQVDSEIVDSFLESQIKPQAITQSQFMSTTDDGINQAFLVLAKKTGRMELIPILKQIDELSEELNRLIAQMLPPQPFNLLESLHQLSLELGSLSNSLMQLYLNTDKASFNLELEQQINSFVEIKELSSKLIDSATNIPLIQQFKLLCSNHLNQLPQQLYSLCRSLHQKETIEPTSLEHNKLRNRAVLTGVIANKQVHRCLFSLLRWHLKVAHHDDEKLIFMQALPTLLKNTSIDDWQNATVFLEQQLTQYDEIQVLLNELRYLTRGSLSLNDLVNIFMKTDEEILESFINFTAGSPQTELSNIAKAVLFSKKENIPLRHLIDPALVGDLSSELSNALDHITAHANHIMSIKALKAGLYSDGGDCLYRLNQLRDCMSSHAAELSMDAIKLIINSYQRLFKTDLLSPESQSFVLSLAQILKYKSLGAQLTILAHLSIENTALLMQQCLSGLNSVEYERKEASRFLLTTLAQCGNIKEETRFKLIKNMLSAQDLTIIDDDELKQLAESILLTTSTEEETTVNGVWIARLLSSPQFVAASTPEMLQKLCERYRLISLTLKQDEFETLNHFLQAHLTFSHTHELSLHEELANHPARLEKLIEKREKLLKFRASDSVRALCIFLEEHCKELRHQDPLTADKALENLYTHYNQQLTNQRVDRLFNRMSNFIYYRAFANAGDIQAAQSTVLQWLEYLPHQNFVQTELSRKQQTYLFNEKGKMIGYLSEGNQAMTLVENKPIALLGFNKMVAGTAFYDENRRRIGTLASNGEVEFETNLFQKDTTAMLISTVPQEQLSHSPVALQWLMQDVLKENSIDTLYNCKNLQSNSEKRDWIEQQLSQTLACTKQRIHLASVESLIRNHKSDSVLALLGEMKEAVNAEDFFHALLANDNKRRAFFNGKKSHAYSFLNRFNQKAIFANFLLHHNKEPWFHDGLIWFAHYANECDKPNLLNDALQVIKNKVEKKEINVDSYDQVINALVGKDATVKIILEQFFGDNVNTTTIQKALCDNPHLKQFTSFLSKSHLLPLVKSLNTELTIKSKPRYRLLLMAFAEHQERLFAAKEYRFNKEQTWHSEELATMTNFVKRHLKFRISPDENFLIGRSLLAELLFRSANFGQIDLFYNADGSFDHSIAKRLLERSLLDTIAAYLCFPKKLVTNALSVIRGLFDEQYLAQQERHKALIEKGAMIDWNKMSADVWQLTNGTTVSIFAAYLLNYAGEVASLEQLINDYFSSVLVVDKTHLKPLSQIMVGVPNRDVSRIIFKAFEEHLNARPDLLDDDLLNQLARFHQQTNLGHKNPLPSYAAELALLNHFGQQKAYPMVHKTASLLLTKVQQEGKSQQHLAKKLRMLMIEAKVENQLSGHVGYWYFSIMQWVKRGWNYFNKSPSKLLKFCDDESVYENPEQRPETIRTTVLGGQMIELLIETRDVNKKNMARLRDIKADVLEQKIPAQIEPINSVANAINQFGVLASVRSVDDSAVTHGLATAAL